MKDGARMRKIRCLFLLLAIVAGRSAASQGIDWSKYDPNSVEYARTLKDMMHANPDHERVDAVTRSIYREVTELIRLQSEPEKRAAWEAEVLAKRVRAWCLLSLALEWANSEQVRRNLPMYERPTIEGVCNSENAR
jgi:uncharacterized heparinase superfamily protein